MRIGRIYYDKDASLKHLRGKTVGIIGYGIQGRAQALNIRDSGVKVLIANRRDKYRKQATKDGFKIYEIDRLVEAADIILFLIPDQAQKMIYKKFVEDHLSPGKMLVFAHGYSLRYNTVKPPPFIDVAMLAPRMPGRQIRDYFLKGSGVPAFIDVIQDKSGLAGERLLSLAKAAGFTKAGAMGVGYKDEAELDLFMEQFLVAAIIKAIATSFKVLVDEFNYPPIPALMELYASSELAEVLRMASRLGIGMVFQKNASPTCQYGVASHFKSAMGIEPDKKARRVIKNIKNGAFAKKLDKEGMAGYPEVRRLWANVNSKPLLEAQKWINKSFRERGE